jgi:hypothetical protein
MLRKLAFCSLGILLVLAFWSWRAENPQAQNSNNSSPMASPTPEVTASPETSPSPTPAASPTPSYQQHSYFDATARWPESSIYVCWENPLPQFADQMALVKQSVAESWEAASAVRFTGWQRCATTNMGIRILIDDSGPRTLGLGVNLNGVVNGMILNFTFNNWGTACRDQLNMCIKSIAVHEFGHALGFAHEQNRPDAPGECQQLAQGSNGTALLTPYDPQSVMNYCNPNYNNLGVLSRYDSEAVQKIYGRTLGPTVFK